MEVTLVVCGEKFQVGREMLISRCVYFKTMFEKHFIESKKNSIELQGVPSAESFAVLLEYILYERVSVVSKARVLIDALCLSEMYLVDGFKEDLRNDILLSWSSIENIEELIVLAESLDVDDEILEISMNFVWNALCIEGKEVMDELQGGQREINMCSYFDEGERGISPNRVIEMIAVQVFKERLECFRKSCFKQNMIFFLGVLSWVNRYGFVKENVGRLFSCLNLRFLPFKEVVYYLDKMEDLAGERHILRDRIEQEFSIQRTDIREHVNKIITGSLSNNECIMSRFNLNTWTWNTLCTFTIMHPHFNTSLMSENVWYLFKKTNMNEYHFLAVPKGKDRSEQDLNTICSHSLVQKQRFSSVFLNNDRVSLDYYGNSVLHNGKVYFAGSTRTLVAYLHTFIRTRSDSESVDVKIDNSKFRICKYDPTSYYSWHTTFAEMDFKFDRMFCQLLVIGDTLHCVVSFAGLSTKTWTTSICSLDLTKELGHEIQLETLFEKCSSPFIPVSLTSVECGILILFRHSDSLWITLYDPEAGRFQPLGFIPDVTGGEDLQYSVEGVSQVTNKCFKNNEVVEEWLKKSTLIRLATPPTISTSHCLEM